MGEAGNIERLRALAEALGPFGWPLAAVLMVVAAMLIFRSPLGRLVDRVSSVGRHGIDTVSPPSAGAKQSAEATGEKAPKPWSEMNQSLVLLAEIEVLTKQLDEAVQGDDPKRREELLVAALATATISAAFNRIYLEIFGSQILALQALNSLGDGGMGRSSVEAAYEQAVEREPEFFEGSSYEVWLSFLLETGLLQDAGDSRVAITVRGREFLRYLIGQGLSLSRPH